MNIATISKQIRAFADQLDATSEVEKPDPYAELKAAHAAGKVIQILDTQNRYVDADPTWQSPPERYRIKPEEPAFQLPPPPPGVQWHRTDMWEKGDLPEGMRPLFLGEPICEQVDEWKQVEQNANTWVKRIRVYPDECTGAQAKKHSLHRTTRPLTFEHAGETWTWHRPGDPMPCDGGSLIWALYDDGTPSLNSYCANDYVWGRIIGWRYADEKKTVPLGPEDVPPGSSFRPKHWGTTGHERIEVVQVCTTDVRLGTNRTYDFEELEASWQINRSIPLTGKWNPDAWEPCSKTIPV